MLEGRICASLMNRVDWFFLYLFQAYVQFLYPLKTSEKQGFSDVLTLPVPIPDEEKKLS